MRPHCKKCRRNTSRLREISHVLCLNRLPAQLRSSSHPFVVDITFREIIMKCLYYLAPNLDVSKRVSDDLHNAGVTDWYIHIISKDEAGLSQKHLHSSNYLETLDLVRGTTVGGLVGFIVSLILVTLAIQFEPFGFKVSNNIYFVVVVFFTLFGIWEGGLFGIESENKKIQPFHQELEKGRYLILIYADKAHESAIRSMMELTHPESQLVATDRHFINPFSKLKIHQYSMAKKVKP